MFDHDGDEIGTTTLQDPNYLVGCSERFIEEWHRVTLVRCCCYTFLPRYVMAMDEVVAISTNSFFPLIGYICWVYRSGLCFLVQQLILRLFKAHMGLKARLYPIGPFGPWSPFRLFLLNLALLITSLSETHISNGEAINLAWWLLLLLWVIKQVMSDIVAIRYSSKH